MRSFEVMSHRFTVLEMCTGVNRVQKWAIIVIMYVTIEIG
jgi:hypothetical protein